MVYKYTYNRTLISFSKSNRKEQTDAEKLLWHKLRGKQLKGYKFKRQFPVQNYILDFYCSEKKLAVELDGSQHIQNEYYDAQREKMLSKLGIKTLRFWDNQVLQETNHVLEAILIELTSSSINEPHPSPLLKGEGTLDNC